MGFRDCRMRGGTLSVLSSCDFGLTPFEHLRESVKIKVRIHI